MSLDVKHSPCNNPSNLQGRKNNTEWLETSLKELDRQEQQENEKQLAILNSLVGVSFLRC
jgi:hypothetical protein